MNYRARIIAALNKGAASIKQLTSKTKIVEPSVRKILGTGAKKGQFKRIARGVYTLSTDEGNYAYIESGDAVTAVHDLADSGLQFDMIFLDPPYYSVQLIGRNRRKKHSWYKFIMPEEFKGFMDGVYKLAKPDAHVYLMLSGAPSAGADMAKYITATLDAGFTYIDTGSYTKTYKDGSPVLNIRGKHASAEKIFLFSKSGTKKEGEIPYILHHIYPRPSTKISYNTEKPPGLIRQIIRQSTVIGDTIADFFGGSGVTAIEGLLLQRNVILFEIAERVVNRFTMRKLKGVYASH
jgi:DNA modification methylase